MKKTLLKLLFAVTLLVVSQLVYSQVTTAGINGRIVGANKESLPGATIVAVHVASGSQYGTTADLDGYFRIIDMRVGGPYTVTVSYVGFKTYTRENIYLNLGQTYGIDVTLSEESAEIAGVEVVGVRNDLFDGNRTGAVTNVTNQQISALPTISRSINDYTRLSPFTGVGNSFAGRDGRYNNITIDGANFNNNFGLSSKNLPGGDAQPISLDAIEEISVNIAPFDIRQSNFTGANINAVTRGGDNTFKGSAYTFFRNKSLTGKYVGDDTLTLSKNTTNVYGARVGRPIIKDKLFFFVNAETEKSIYPGILWNPSDPENGVEADPDNYISRTTVADMGTMRQHLIDTYGYDPGNYENFGDFESKNNKFLAKIDWNIHKNHKLTVRYNYVKSTNDQEVNATSAPLPRSSYGRIGAYSMAFEKANYNFLNTVSSLTAELNSVLGNNVSNKFLVTYTKIRDTRDSDSEEFPFVDIYEDGNPYMSFGYELFTYENDVKNNIFSITDNVSYFLGKHTLTAGFSFEHMYFGNSYKRYGTSYYRYASMDDFMNGAAPTAFGLTYPYENAGDGYAELNFGWGSLYAQDEYQATDNLKLTGGLRFEMPFYFDDLLPNASISELTFKDKDGADMKLDVSQWPDSKIMLSPRIGFNWDAMGDKTLQVRGGTGLFTGRLPFVWFTNQPTNSGTLQNTIEITDSATLSTLIFNKDPLYHLSKFPTAPGSTPPGNIAVVSPDFKMPQVWRTNLAADYKLPVSDLVFTFEFMYTKDMNPIIQYNANQVTPTDKFAGPDDRYKFPSGTANRRINPGIATAMVLDNGDEGYGYSLTFQLSKPFTKGFFGMLAYTYTLSKDLSANPGSAANSAWQSNPSINHQNDPELSYSQFAVPHRIIGAVSYYLEYAQHFGTTFSLYYSGSNQGRLTYIYSNDMNGDGNTADIMYIPKDASEIQFVDIKNSAGEVLFSADQQNTAFWAYVDQDDYLKEHKGEYAERYGTLMPWYHRLDLRILQDVFTTVGKNDRKHSLQISLDMLNFANLLNRDWGILKRQVMGTYDITLLKYEGVDDNGTPKYSMNRSGSKLPTETYTNVLSTSSTWGAQIGLRYTF